MEDRDGGDIELPEAVWQTVVKRKRHDQPLRVERMYV
jgi:hypothetical protein